MSTDLAWYRGLPTLIVGLAPAPDSDPLVPLGRSHASGRRLHELAGVDCLAEWADVANLWPTWAEYEQHTLAPALHRRLAARRLGRRLLSDRPCAREVVCLGRDVASAMMLLHDLPLLSRVQGADGRVWTLLPHPSGRARTWNDVESARAAARLLHLAIRRPGEGATRAS